jgi:hypothetical protein
VASRASPDGYLGFRMFPEASTFSVRLIRETSEGPQVVPTFGQWKAKDAAGTIREHSVDQLLGRRGFTPFEGARFASYGADAQLSRWTAMVQYLGEHLEGDVETQAFVLEVDLMHNGRAPVRHTVRAPVRHGS